MLPSVCMKKRELTHRLSFRGNEESHKVDERIVIEKHHAIPPKVGMTKRVNKKKKRIMRCFLASA